MISELLNLLVLLATGVILVFICGTCLHFRMKKENEKSREEALKVQTSEPSQTEESSVS